MGSNGIQLKQKIEKFTREQGVTRTTKHTSDNPTISYSFSRQRKASCLAWVCYSQCLKRASSGVPLPLKPRQVQRTDSAAPVDGHAWGRKQEMGEERALCWIREIIFRSVLEELCIALDQLIFQQAKGVSKTICSGTPVAAEAWVCKRLNESAVNRAYD